MTYHYQLNDKEMREITPTYFKQLKSLKYKHMRMRTQWEDYGIDRVM